MTEQTEYQGMRAMFIAVLAMFTLFGLGTTAAGSAEIARQIVAGGMRVGCCPMGSDHQPDCTGQPAQSTMCAGETGCCTAVLPNAMEIRPARALAVASENDILPHLSGMRVVPPLPPPRAERS
ncbi:MAG: hypothetical protein K2P68_03775 [Sphingomonas sp.]|nr:hypothetical protein [Sphingomonas sp.]